jgi:PTH1 family peptidyl-tRNA hydrolase
MILLVGLGNPGGHYLFNRHNIGFMAVDAIWHRHGFALWRSRFQGAAAEGRLGEVKSLLLKPQTYMNESGRSVAAAMRFYKIGTDAVIVFHDELDLAPGKLRTKTGGGVAGHKGLRSIADHVGPDFRRVRLGIGHPGDKDLVHDYVLHDFAKADRDWLEPLLAAIAEHAPLIAAGRDSSFMNKVHLTLNPPEEEPDGADGEQPD